MNDRGEQSGNICTSVTVVDSPPKVTWKELPLHSIEVFNDTLIHHGEYGAVVVRGMLSRNFEEKSQTCAVKILKGTAVEIHLTFF